MRNKVTVANRGRAGLVLGLVLALAACTAPPPPAEPNDPDEAKNRDTHELNGQIDTYVLRPVSEAFATVTPKPMRIGIRQAADNWDLPATVMNNIFQFRLGDAAENTARFAVNSTVGLLGFLDVATPMGIEGNPTDFGETLHVWGAGEGQYGELPGYGPSTTRDTAGLMVDLAINPLTYMFPGTTLIFTGLRGASILVARSDYSETIDSVLYDSADSYAQTRLLYLQNRRFELGQVPSESSFEDPYEDPYAQ